jgi:hypothetical protein
MTQSQSPVRPFVPGIESFLALDAVRGPDGVWAVPIDLDSPPLEPSFEECEWSDDRT